jgi:hypothetical protein
MTRGGSQINYAQRKKAKQIRATHTEIGSLYLYTRNQLLEQIRGCLRMSGEAQEGRVLKKGKLKISSLS